MSLPLTLVSAAYASDDTNFGQALNGGYGSTSSTVIPTALPFTLRGRVKTSSSVAAVEVAFGAGGYAWFGKDTAGKAVAHFGSSTDYTIATTTTINDGNWHDVELVVTSSGGVLYIDGAVAGSQAATNAAIGIAGRYFAVRAFFNASNTSTLTWTGEVNEVAVFSSALHTAAFTPPTAPYTGSEANLLALYHLDGNGSDSTAQASALTISAPSTGSVGTPYTVTVGANGALASAVTVNLTATDGTYSATSVTLTTAAPTASVTYTPVSNGAKTLTATDAATTLSPASTTLTASSTAPTAVTLSTSASGTVGAAQTVTVGVNGTVSSNVVVALGASPDGTLSSSSVTLTSGSPTGSVTYTPTGSGVKTLTGTATSLTSGTSTVTVASAPAFDQTKVLFSPGNWNVGTSSAKTINDGAYFRTIFTGASITLGFDVSGTSSPVPKLTYRVDGIGGWTTVDLAASIAITMPSETSGWTTHFIEVHVAQTSEAISRWSPQSTAIILTSITLASGGALTLPAKRSLSGLFFGDSIFCGINALTTGGDSTVRGRAQLSYAHLTAEALNCEYGIAAFGGQGWVTTGGGSVPVFPTTYGSIYSGVTRSFAGFDFIVINQGQNDASNATTTQVTAVLNALIAATQKTCLLIVLRPLSGLQAANLQAGIAATSDPTRVKYVDTAGWFTTANSLDGVHPIGWEHKNNITPQCVAALRALIAPQRGTRVQRTISLNLVDGSGAARANLTGIKWAIHDQPTPDALKVASDAGTGATTNGSGLLTLSVYSTLAAGSIVWLTLSNSDGTTTQSPAAMGFAGPVALA